MGRAIRDVARGGGGARSVVSSTTRGAGGGIVTMESGQMITHYRLVEKIGEGGMGVVWKAEDTILGRTVAIKVLPAEVSRDPSRRKMFLDEARLASQVSEANIVQVHEFGHEAGLDFIVMEYVEGQPLAALMTGRPIDTDRVARLGHQVARALSRAHRKGLIHRDLKPANILVTPDGDAKVVDFGLATLFQPSGDTAAETRSSLEEMPTREESATSSAIVGTLLYMSPEQVRGETLTAHTDIFSLGVILYEMTTGKKPFGGATRVEIASEILKARPVPVHDHIPRVPLDLERIIQKTMAASTRDRYQTMEDLAVDLKRLSRDLETGSSPSYEDLRQVVPPAAGTRRTGLIAAIAAAAFIALGVTAWMAGWIPGKGGAPAIDVDPRAILILPLEVRGQAEGGEYVGRTFAEALAVNLAQEEALHVLPLPDDTGPQGSEARIRAARARGAGLLLTGALTRSGDAVQASLSLVDTQRNRILWGAQKEVPEGGLTGLASSLAAEGIGKLGFAARRMHDDPRRISGSPALNGSPLYAEVVGQLNRFLAIESLDTTRRLVEAFPDEFAAHVLRTEALAQQFLLSPLVQQTELVRSIDTLDRLAPGTPYAVVYRAIVEPRMEASLRMLDEVIARDDLSPSMRAWIHRNRGWTLRNGGETEQAVADFESALRLDPTDATSLGNLGYVLREAGRTEEALARARQAVALEPTVWWFHHAEGHVLSGMDRFAEATEAYGRGCAIHPSMTPCAALAGTLLQVGRREEAMTAAARASKMETTLAGSYNLACFWAQAGDRERAIGFLEESVKAGFGSLWLSTDPDLEPLHGDPRFEAIVDQIRAARRGGN